MIISIGDRKDACRPSVWCFLRCLFSIFELFEYTTAVGTYVAAVRWARLFVFFCCAGGGAGGVRSIAYYVIDQMT